MGITSQDLIETQSLSCATWESRSEGNGAVSFSMFQKCKSCTVENNVTMIRCSDGPPRAHHLQLRDSSWSTSAWETWSLVLVMLNEDWNMRLFLHPSLHLEVFLVPNSVYFYNLMCFRVKKHEEWLLYTWIEVIVKMNVKQKGKSLIKQQNNKQNIKINHINE